MNLMHLKYAVEIARTKSISRAADNLFMGQPNLSRAIKELEENINITIFNRTSKGITITKEGREFLVYAQSIIDQVDEVEKKYKSGLSKKQRFSICVPRSSYISYAFAQFSKSINADCPSEILYKETGFPQTFDNVIKGNYNLGIIRYENISDKHVKYQLDERSINYEHITDFKYKILMSKDSPLAKKENIKIKDLENYIEINHSDPHTPFVKNSDQYNEEFNNNVSKYIYVYERASQFTLLEKLTNSFMWVSPVPEELSDKFGLVSKECPQNNKIFRDMLIYRKNYILSDLDNCFINELCSSKRKYIK